MTQVNEGWFFFLFAGECSQELEQPYLILFYLFLQYFLLRSFLPSMLLTKFLKQ